MISTGRLGFIGQRRAAGRMSDGAGTQHRHSNVSLEVKAFFFFTNILQSHQHDTPVRVNNV